MTDADSLTTWADRLPDLVSLTPRDISLILIAVCSSPTGYGAGLLDAAVAFGRRAALPQADIDEAKRLGSLIVFHSVTWGLKVVAEEFAALGIESGTEPHDIAELRRDFLRNPARTWDAEMQVGAAHSPRGIAAMLTYISDSVKGSAMTSAERELVCIAIDMNCTHMYEDGLRRHVRASVRAGVTPAQVTDVSVILFWQQRAAFAHGR